MDEERVGIGLGVSEEDYQRLLARIEVFQETIVMTRFDGDGQGVATYEVAPESLAAAFAGIPIATGLLPKNVLFYSRDDRGERIGVFLPRCVRRLAVVDGGERRVYRIALPPMVFAGHETAYVAFACKQRPGEDDRLYHAPLPNVHTNGKICAGSVEFPVCSLGTIYRAAKAFFGSDFNQHLVNRKSKAQPDDVTAMWAALAGSGAAWPLDDLVPIGSLTMGRMMRGEW